MDKEKVISAVLEELEKKKLELQDSVENFKKSAGEQSKSIESWSDSSRAQFNMMAGAIQNEVRALESAAVFLKSSVDSSSQIIGIGSLVEVKENKQSKFYFLVPEGSGGFVVEIQNKEVLVIATTSPLGSVLVGKKAGDQVVFNGKAFEIVEIS